ncbi:hypothetical protein ACQBAU_11030 [Propionibacteriaceae bacterium Y2011]|uniref:hypothetical protein n=1 Tax=Microlunatus sp. Y2014 TaxID=3418488 RepID=UPI003B4E172C
MPITRITGVDRAATDLDPDHGFDPTHGYSVADLLTVGAPADPPADFAEFWQGVYAEALAVDPDPRLGPWRELTADEVGGPVRPGQQVADLLLTSLDGVRLGGWVVRGEGETTRALVQGHGYGGRSNPGQAPVNTLSVQPVARMLPGSPDGGIDAWTHVLIGIESRHTSSLVGSTADMWAGVTVATMLAPGLPVGYAGGSFGGGIGALALPHDPRITAAQLTVPSFGNQPLRLRLRCTGSGRALTEYHLQHPEVERDVLAYLDSATAATLTTIPVMVIAAAADPAVPPPGQFAVATSMAGPTWLHVVAAGHASWPEQPANDAEVARLTAAWWADPASVVHDPPLAPVAVA